MDRYAKTLLTKVGHIFILYQPLRERKYVSFTKAKIWVLEICPKIASHATFFTFLFISQERDCLGKIYLITSDQQGCRNLGQDQSEKFWLLARRQFHNWAPIFLFNRSKSTISYNDKLIGAINRENELLKHSHLVDFWFIFKFLLMIFKKSTITDPAQASEKP